MLDSSTQASGAGLVTGLVPWLVCLAVFSSVLGGVQAAKLRPQHTLPFFPYRYGLPSGRKGHAMATAADGSVWMFGGVREEGGFDGKREHLNDLLKLDLQERRWHNVTTTGPRPRGRESHAMTTVANGTRLLVFGGKTGSFADPLVLDDTWTFNVLNAEWTQLTARVTGAWPSARYGHAMVAVSDTRVLLFGGEFDSYTQLDEAWTFNVLNTEWTQLTAAGGGAWPSARSFHAMAAVNDTRVILFGGEEGGGKSDELWSLDVPSTNWTQLTVGASGAWPSARWRHAMAAVSNTRVLLFGGAGPGPPPGRSDELWSLDVPSTTWTKLTAGASGAWPRGRRDHAMVAASDTRVILFGGDTGSGTASGNSDELLSLDFLAAANHTVRWTRLNDENVTAEELWEQFNNVQVGGCCVGVSVEDSLS